MTQLDPHIPTVSPSNPAQDDKARFLAGFRALVRWAKTGKRLEANSLASYAACAATYRGEGHATLPSGMFPLLDEILRGDFAGQVIEEAWEILAAPLPVIDDMAHCPQNTPFHAWNVLGHTARVVDASPATSLSRWAALLHDCGKPACRRTDMTGRDHFKGHDSVGCKIADGILRDIEAPDKLREAICLLVCTHENYTAADAASCDDMLLAFDNDINLYFALTSLQIADASAKSPGVTERRDAALGVREYLRTIKGHGNAAR